jgi:YcxB-like protein
MDLGRTMEIDFKLTRVELGTLFRIGIGPGYAWSHVIAAVPIVALFAICFVTGGWAFGLVITASGLAVVAFQFRPGTATARLEKRGEKMIEKDPLLDSDRRLRLTDAGVERRLDHVATTFQWPDIEYVSESQGLIQLKLRGTKRGCVSVPRRAFDSDAQADAFVRYAEARIRPGVAS